MGGWACVGGISLTLDWDGSKLSLMNINDRKHASNYVGPTT